MSSIDELHARIAELEKENAEWMRDCNAYATRTGLVPLARLEEAVELGQKQANGFDRYWKAAGVLDPKVTVDDAIARHRALVDRVEAAEALLKHIAFTYCGITIGEDNTTLDMVPAFVEGAIDRQEERANKAEAMIKARAPVPFATDHAGLKVSASGLLTRCAEIVERTRVGKARGYGYVLREELLEHLEEVARRFYAGDLTVVDEFCQLYCLGEQARKEAKGRASS